MSRKPFKVGGERYRPVDDMRWRYERADGTHAFDKVRLTPLDRNGQPPPRELHRGKEYAYDVPDPDFPGAVVQSNQSLPPDAPDLLYRLPQVLQAVSAGETIYWTEGEKDADTLVTIGRAATCHHQGAMIGATLGQAQSLRGATRIVVVMDRDEAGIMCALRRYDLLTRLPIDGGIGMPNDRVEVRCVPGHGEDPRGLINHTVNDASDWIGAPGLNRADRLRRVRRLRRLDVSQLRAMAPATPRDRDAAFGREGYASGDLAGWRNRVQARNARSRRGGAS